MTFYSRLQAELKAQIGNQEFVNRICQTQDAYNTIVNELYPNKKSIPGPKKLRFFVSVCEILSQRLVLKDVDISDQAVCAKLLQDRLNSIVSNPIVLGSMPNQFTEWKRRLEEYVDEDAV